MNPFFLSILQFVFILAIAPFSIGLVRTVKARLQGRHGASPFLPYVTFVTLLKKEMVISKSTSWIFRLTPFVVLGTTVLLAGVLPLLTVGGVLFPLSDFVLVAGLLVLGAIFLVMGGLDGASAFGGMGASREMTLAALLEPAVMVMFGAFALASHRSTVDGMMQVGGHGLLSHPYLLFSLLALFLIALAENARYPVDNPATHLELTMVHEAMILEYSGPYLAMLEYASSIKLTIFALLITNFFFPFSLLSSSIAPTISLPLALVFGCLKIIVMMALLGLLESSIAKMRFYRMQEYASSAFFLALAGFVLALIYSV